MELSTLSQLQQGGSHPGTYPGYFTTHKTLRQLLVEEQKLDAVISLPGGVFKPYAGVSTANRI